MNQFILDASLALWFGILTSISPCPLTTNIASISYVGRMVGSTRSVLYAGLLYTIGRMFAYTLIGVLVLKSLLGIPSVSNFLQHYLTKIIGPLCIVTGFFMLNIFRLGGSGNGVNSSLQDKINRTGIWGAGILGLLFALTFCPTSAGLFFGGLIPLAVKNNSVFALPILYGLGTALPVVFFSFVLAFGTQIIGSLFKKIVIIELWVRRITAAFFIIAGIVLILKNNFIVYLGF
jgi:hypothetical protein